MCPVEKREEIAFLGVDVSKVAITSHVESLRADVESPPQAKQISGHVIVSAFLYDVADGGLREVIAPERLADLRS